MSAGSNVPSGTRLPRRRLLGSAALAAVGSLAADPRPSRAAADTLSAGILGCGIRGKAHAELLGRQPGCVIGWVCDPDRGRAEKLADEIAGRQAARPRVAADLRQVIDDRGIDLVTIASPNHWHALSALWAMQAGKDVYVEKPVCHSLEEGDMLAAAVARHGRICQVGTQARSSSSLAEARAFVRGGGLGRVRLARAIYHAHRKPIGGPGTFPPPEGVDLDLFFGPAAVEPQTRPHFHYDWHWFWGTGDGELGNNGIHLIDVVRLLTGLEGSGEATLSFGTRAGYDDAGQTPHTQTVVTLFPETTLVTEVCGLKTVPPVDGVEMGVVLHGAEGTLRWSRKTAVATVEDRAGRPVREFVPAGPPEAQAHVANFLAAVRSRDSRSLAAPVDESRRSTAVCHLGNISHRVGAEATFAEIESRLAERRPADDVAVLVARMRGMLADNGCLPEAGRITCGPWLETRARESDAGMIVGNPGAAALSRLAYRSPYVPARMGAVPPG